MDFNELRRRRLANQGIRGPADRTPAQVVSSLGAMQAQEYFMAQWAIGLRSPRLTRNDVEEAFQKGEILRTHLLRPTWHFTTPEDIRWLLKLTAPQVHRLNGTYYRKRELDDPTLFAASTIIGQALADEGALTRQELADRLARRGIEASGNRLAYIVMYAELEGLICSGPRRRKQFTYQLLDAVAPKLVSYKREDALACLATRFFTSRGPATDRDFSYWSGLNLTDARKGAAMLGPSFESLEIQGQTYYGNLGHVLPGRQGLQRSTFLLPDYDEYGMSYKDRSFMVPKQQPEQAPSPYSHWLVLGGCVAGTWEIKKEGVIVKPYGEVSKAEQRNIDSAVDAYQRFNKSEKKGLPHGE